MAINFPSTGTTHTHNGKTWVYDGIGWISQSNVSGSSGSSVTVSDTAPSDPSSGDLWWNSDEGVLKIYYQDVDSAQWVNASHSGSGGSSGSDTTIQTIYVDAPAGHNNTTRYNTSYQTQRLISPKTGNIEFKFKTTSTIVSGESFTIQPWVGTSSNLVSSPLTVDVNNYTSPHSISFDAQELDLFGFVITWGNMNNGKQINGFFRI